MNDAPRPAVQVGPIHYQILAAAGLTLILLAQLDQILGALLVVCVGLFGLVGKMRAAPLFVLIAFAASKIGNAWARYGSFNQDTFRPLLDPNDLLAAIGLVAYIAAHFRLQSLSIHILPVDPRQRQEQPLAKGRWGHGRFVPVQQKRDRRLLTAHEIARFVLALPFWALIGQALWLIIVRPWTPSVLPDRVHRLITLAWLLIVGTLIAGTIFAQWRRRQMDRAAAQGYLQDTLWRETRREQRRIFRWLTWRRLHERTRQTATSSPHVGSER